jgi:two-component system, NarL family, sensor kinase
METAKEIDIFLFLFTGTIGMIILAGGLITFFMVYQRRLMRKQAELHDLAIKHKEELLYNNIEMLEQERKRIAKDLHDDIGHVFSTLSWKLHQLTSATNGEDNGKILLDSQELIHTGIRNVKSITYDMIPYGFEIFGLLTVIQNLCDRVISTGRLDIHFEYPDEQPVLPEDAGINIYRIIQELISNTIKYASASIIRLHLVNDGDTLCLHYSDNGCGFDMEQIKKQRGFGLRNIESRIHMLGAAYHFNTAPGKGIQVDIIIPINKLHGINHYTGSSSR